jgi:5-formyltetrahydrofolate cyclo-ligase
VTKADIRRDMRSRFAGLGPERAEMSQAVVMAIAAHPGVVERRRIALFSPLPSEPDVEGLWKLAPGPFCYPRIVQGEMEFVDVGSMADLTTSPWHPKIREHARSEAPAVQPTEIDVILVPGLAFTRRGQRLGRGGGYYDRYLASLPAETLKIGVCFGFQIFESLPTESHDQTVDGVVTEAGFLS